MAQLRIPGFPAGSIQINSSVSVLKKDGLVTHFVGSDNYFSHAVDDDRGERLAIATLMVNSHVRAVEVTRSDLAIPHRTLMRWSKQLQDEGAGSFYAPPRRRGPPVMTAEACAESRAGANAHAWASRSW